MRLAYLIDKTIKDTVQTLQDYIGGNFDKDVIESNVVILNNDIDTFIVKIEEAVQYLGDGSDARKVLVTFIRNGEMLLDLSYPYSEPFIQKTLGSIPNIVIQIIKDDYNENTQEIEEREIQYI